MATNQDDNSKDREVHVGSDVVFGSGVMQGGDANRNDDGDPAVDADDEDELPAAPRPHTANVGADLAGRDLSGAQFDGCNFEDADFAGATLRGTSFRGAKLTGAAFDGADLQGADL